MKLLSMLYYDQSSLSLLSFPKFKSFDALCKVLTNMLDMSTLQIKQFNEPIEVRITEWSSNGLLTRIEV